MAQPGFWCEVVGESHANADGTKRQDVIARLQVGDELMLRHEPQNPHDENAIAVHVRDGARYGHQIGYIERQYAENLADEVRDGYTHTACVRNIWGGTADKPSRGIQIEIWSYPPGEDPRYTIEQNKPREDEGTRKPKPNTYGATLTPEQIRVLEMMHINPDAPRPKPIVVESAPDDAAPKVSPAQIINCAVILLAVVIAFMCCGGCGNIFNNPEYDNAKDAYDASQRAVQNHPDFRSATLTFRIDFDYSASDDGDRVRITSGFFALQYGQGSTGHAYQAIMEKRRNGTWACTSLEIE